MLEQLALDPVWSGIPVDCRSSLMEAAPSVAVARASRNLTDDVVRALLRAHSEEVAKKVRPSLLRMGDSALPLLLEPTADPKWCVELAGSVMSSVTGARCFVDWVLDREEPVSTESELRKAAALAWCTVPDTLVAEDRRVEFLRKMGPPAAVQQLARSWADVDDDVVWELLVGDQAAAATEVLGTPWYRAGGQHHIPVVLSYRRALYDKALETEELAHFCPHALWWEDGHADSLPGIDWEKRECSPSSQIASALLSLTWCPATTPERAEAILEMATAHQSLSALWGRTAGAATGRVRQNRPAIDLTTVSDAALQDKMVNRITKKRWPERFAEAVLLARNGHYTSNHYRALDALSSQLSHVMPGSEIANDPAVASVMAQNRASTITAQSLPDQRQQTQEMGHAVSAEWDRIADLSHADQLRFWAMLDSLVETRDTDLGLYIDTTLELLH